MALMLWMRHFLPDMLRVRPDGSGEYATILHRAPEKKELDAILYDLPTFDTLDNRDDSWETRSLVSDDALSDPGIGIKFEIEAYVRRASEVLRWRPECFVFERSLIAAARNRGTVDVMRAVDTGEFVAVKRMPNSWTCASQKEFEAERPRETERPWIDVAIVKFLNDRGWEYVCKLVGVYKSEEETFVLSSFAPEGDLFTWSQRPLRPGPTREFQMYPIVKQLLLAIKELHAIGICHGDVSPENVLLTLDKDGAPHIKLIDFGMAVVSEMRWSEARGKQSYQAPEMHAEPTEEGADVGYNPFVAEVFSVGVVIFVMATQDYPWMSTRPGRCRCFDFVCKHGFACYLKKRKLRTAPNTYLITVLSQSLANLVGGLTCIDPDSRMTINEDALTMGASVWDAEWLQEQEYLQQD
eukprot:TRINITY_DN28259_c0_g1_i1.p1 TRINITY_DN28259_c0_g1~~TRINITY_DN28259_c0_g1_i1.p1  ORF type:complete len:411 (-),score=62.90 TRINITY_DN28259_c0_g1_i1:214-1446(-)